MSRKSENQTFICQNCGLKVVPLTNGSYRNHCPQCLHSIHVDDRPGDRGNACKGLMRPIGIRNTPHKGIQIIHECTVCKAVKVNKVAEGCEQPDSIDQIIKLMV